MTSVVRSRGDAVERRLDLALGVDVERRGRLVEDQDRRRLEDGAGDGDALLLAAGEFQAALADLGLVAVGQRLDEVGRSARYRAAARTSSSLASGRP